ncbi:MAG: hypothetical protein ABW221_05320 [Vicinamibacteria bacterium]
MRRSVWPAAWCAPALLAFAMTADAAPAAAKKKAEPKREPATAAPTQVKPGESGLVVIRDKDTGELRAPEAGEAGLLQAVPANNHSDEGLVDVAHPRGGVTRDLQGRFQEYFVVTRGADGTLKPVCVNDPAQAERLAKTAASTSPAEGEDR